MSNSIAALQYLDCELNIVVIGLVLLGEHILESEKNEKELQSDTEGIILIGILKIVDGQMRARDSDNKLID